jgi:hypothetical protein
VVNPKNAIAVKHMLELIAQRSGEDRANVFLDIIVGMVFHQDDIWNQQQSLNRIAEIYGIDPPTLKFGPNDEIPF